MTISATVDNRISYTGNGSTTAWTVPFPILKNTATTHFLKVIKVTIAGGTEEILVENTGYTVTQSAGDPSTGTVTISPAISSSYKIYIISNITPTQAVDLQNSVAVDMPTLEKSFDKLTLLHQQTEERLSRAILLPETTDVTDLEFPSFKGSAEGDIPTVNSTTDGYVYKSIDELVSVAAFDISGLTAETTTDTAADYLPIYDTSAGAQRKVLLEDLGIGGNPIGAILGTAHATSTANQTTFTQYTWTDITSLSISYTPKKLNTTIYILGNIFLATNTTNNGAVRILVNGVPPETISPEAGRGQAVVSGANDYQGALSIQEIAQSYGVSVPICTQVKVNSLSAMTIKAQAFNTSSTTTDLRINYGTQDFTYAGSCVSQIFIIEVDTTSEGVTELRNKARIIPAGTNHSTASRTIALYTATTGINTNQYFDGIIRADPLSATTYMLLFGCFVGGNVSSSMIRFYKNFSQMMTPTSPSSRVHFNAAHGNAKSAHGILITDTVSSSAGYDMVMQRTSDATYGTTWDRNVSGVTTINSQSNLFQLLMTVGYGLHQAPATSSIAATVDCGSIAYGSFGDPSLSVSITPTSSSSNLLITGQVCVSDGNVGTSGFKLQRDGSDILKGDASSNRTRLTCSELVSTPEIGIYTFMYMVNSTATSATTFKVLIPCLHTAGSNVYLNRSRTDTDSTSFVRGVSNLTVYEFIGA